MSSWPSWRANTGSSPRCASGGAWGSCSSETRRALPLPPNGPLAAAWPGQARTPPRRAAASAAKPARHLGPANQPVHSRCRAAPGDTAARRLPAGPAGAAPLCGQLGKGADAAGLEDLGDLRPDAFDAGEVVGNRGRGRDARDRAARSDRSRFHDAAPVAPAEAAPARMTPSSSPTTWSGTPKAPATTAGCHSAWRSRAGRAVPSMSTRGPSRQRPRCSSSRPCSSRPTTGHSFVRC
jgi:hypothetical protein